MITSEEKELEKQKNITYDKKLKKCNACKTSEDTPVNGIIWS